MRVQGKSVLLTGGSRGVGVHIARAFAKAGARVALVARDAEALARVAEAIVGEGGQAFALAADLSDVRAYPQLIDRAVQQLGTVDILVNNAALEANSAFVEYPAADVEQMLRIDLLAPMLLTQAVLPRMLAARSGHVVNIASLAGHSPTAFDVTYSAAKSGLIRFSHSLRAELKDQGVGVSVVSPGFISDAGMYATKSAETGRSAPKLVGTSTPAQVAAGVIRAIERNRAEVIVNPGPIRLLMALSAYFPELPARISRQAGIDALFAAVADNDRARAVASLPVPAPGERAN
jgi:short-subunit dehydrogenase